MSNQENSNEALLQELAELKKAYISLQNTYNNKINDFNSIEAVIKEKEQEFKKLSSHLPDLIYQFSRRTDGSYYVPIASDGIINIFGCSPEDVAEDFAPISKVLHPDDIERVINDIEFSAKNLTNFTCEFRVNIPGKPVQWILSRSTPEKLPNGEITWYGFNANITELKIAGEKLLQLSWAVEQNPATIVITDLNGSIQYANAKFFEITGYTVEEVLGKNPRILKYGHTSGDEYKLLWETITNGKVWHGEFHNRKKNGEMYWESATIAPIKNKEGIITNFLAIKEDITIRKNAQDKLRKIAWNQSHEIRGPLTSIMGIVEALKFDLTIDEKLMLINKLDEATKKLDLAIHNIVQETNIN